jgi:(4-(4-[2-(gamma-L-glutamylamino)ethyl]phenoxymethyl)furan-2-yl)methanamine synthase
MKARAVPKEKNIIVGFDVGGAHLKAVRVEDGRVVRAQTFATPLWLGLDRLTAALGEAASICAGAERAALTMTGELSDVFASREEGVRGLLDIISMHVPVADKLIYAGRAGYLDLAEAAGKAGDVASANWHATASLVGRLAGDALFVDMGSTTTDILATNASGVANEGYSDGERLLTGELVYTGFTRTFLFGVAASAPVGGRMTPLMNEYFASMADAHRILGVLDEADDKHNTADGKEKTRDASIARLARMVGRDAGDLPLRGWRDIAAWFSEQQLRMVHDAAIRVASRAAEDAPVVGAGTGRWQLKWLAERMDRRYVNLADIIPSEEAARHEAINAAAATAVALLL